MEKENDLEIFARELQAQIMGKIRKQYSEVVIDHWQNPRNFRKIPNKKISMKKILHSNLNNRLLCDAKAYILF